MRNALTIDVEDYFQSTPLPGPWTAPGGTPFPCAGREHPPGPRSPRPFFLKATFFVLGWVARKRPNLVLRIAGRGHEIACHGFGTSSSMNSPGAFPPDCARPGRHRGRLRPARERLPGPELVRDRQIPVGPGRPGRGRLRLRFEHLPHFTTSTHAAARASPTSWSVRRGPGGVSAEHPGAACPARPCPAGVRRRLPAPAPGRPRLAALRRINRARTSPPCSISIPGDRPRQRHQAGFKSRFRHSEPGQDREALARLQRLDFGPMGEIIGSLKQFARWRRGGRGRRRGFRLRRA
jgi:hypothetical protein